jgi:acetyl esterase
MIGQSPGSSQGEIAQKIREQGAVLDVEATHALYRDPLKAQRRDGVSVIRDLEYGAHQQQRLDLYRPEPAAGHALPVAVFFHGGGFVRGDKSQRENFGYYFARQGYAVAVPNYRLAPAHRWPSGAVDVIAVWRWVRARIDGFGGRADVVFLAGESAGAAHVALATLATRFHPPDFKIAGAILISGVYNLQLEFLARRQFRIDSPDPRNEAYFGSDFSRYPQMSTIELIDAAPFPLWISYAELDLVQMQAQAGELFGRLVCKHGFAPHLHVVPGHNHLTQVYAVNTGDESLTRPVLGFLKGHAEGMR